MTTRPDPAGSRDQHEQPPESTPSTNGSAQAEPVRPITIMLPDSLLKKLRVVAIVKETSVSELVADAAAGVVRRELKRALAKISGE